MPPRALDDTRIRGHRTPTWRYRQSDGLFGPLAQIGAFLGPGAVGSGGFCPAPRGDAPRGIGRRGARRPDLRVLAGPGGSDPAPRGDAPERRMARAPSGRICMLWPQRCGISQSDLQEDWVGRATSKKFRKAAYILDICSRFIRIYTPGRTPMPGCSTAPPDASTPSRALKLPEGRGGHIRGIPGLQPFQAVLCPEVRPAEQIPYIMGGEAQMRDQSL